MQMNPLSSQKHWLDQKEQALALFYANAISEATLLLLVNFVPSFLVFGGWYDDFGVYNGSKDKHKKERDNKNIGG